MADFLFGGRLFIDEMAMQCYEADCMVPGVLTKTNWLSLDGKLYFWNRSMAIHSQRARDAQLIMGQIQC